MKKTELKGFKNKVHTEGICNIEVEPTQLLLILSKLND